MFKIDKEKCVGCGVCVNVCPQEAISIVDNKARIDADKCVDCGRCVQVCPQGAIYPGAASQQNISLNQGQMFPGAGFGVGGGRGIGRGMGRGAGRGRRRGQGGGGRWR
ncbi:MAG: 4Fe-4S binding protein [Syntrophaceae bacterium]|nr:4Fe-4S binding protein [Syntrophaceae bacterium]